MSTAGGVHIGSEARARYADGRNCAEAVLGALDGAAGVPNLPDSLGAGFTGGIGHSGCVCGALAGGVAVLGEYATSVGLEPVATRQLAEELAASLHTRFTAQFGSSCCRAIKRGQTPGSDRWLSECSELTEWTAATILGIIAAHAGERTRSRWAPLDALSVAGRVSKGVLAAGALALAAGAVVPAGRVPTVVATGVALSLAAVMAEVGGSAARRAGRFLRVAGAVAAAALASAVAVAPGVGVGMLAPLVDDSAGALVLRAVLAVAAILAAGTAAFRLKRYR